MACGLWDAEQEGPEEAEGPEEEVVACGTLSRSGRRKRLWPVER